MYCMEDEILLGRYELNHAEELKRQKIELAGREKERAEKQCSDLIERFAKSEDYGDYIRNCSVSDRLNTLGALMSATDRRKIDPYENPWRQVWKATMEYLCDSRLKEERGLQKLAKKALYENYFPIRKFFHNTWTGFIGMFCMGITAGIVPWNPVSDNLRYWLIHNRIYKKHLVKIINT